MLSAYSSDIFFKKKEEKKTFQEREKQHAVYANGARPLWRKFENRK